MAKRIDISLLDEWQAAELEKQQLPAKDGRSSQFRRRTPHAGNTKGTKLHPQPLTTIEARMLLNVCTQSFRGLRNSALVVLLWRGMLRCHEAICLRLADVNPATGEVRVLFGKGGRARTVALDPAAMALVVRWIERRRSLPGGDDGSRPLLCGKNGSPLIETNVRRVIRGLGKRAGIGKRVHPHGLRHSGACEMRKAGIDIGLISKALGHKSIATTAIYLNHIAPEDVTNAMRGMTW